MSIGAFFFIRRIRPGAMRWSAGMARVLVLAFAVTLAEPVTGAESWPASDREAVEPPAPEDAAPPPAPAQPREKPDAPADADADRQGSRPAAQASSVRLFGTVEFRSAIKNLPKWERVLDSERNNPSFTPAGLDTKSASVRKRWKELKDKIADAPLREQVQRVNNFFNQWPYKSDREVWGVEDYWATPREFVERSGDCEDYAIAKYYALRDLGAPAHILRVAAVKDAIRGIGHAVLVVYMEDDAYVLDNLTNLVLSHTKLKHYVLQYSVNQKYLWRHVKPKSVNVKK